MQIADKRRPSTLVFLWSLCFSFAVVAAASGEKSCANAAPKSWTADQKKRYCEAASSSGWPSAMECANQARADLKLKYDDVYLLCVDALNSSPVSCMTSLSKKEREQYGVTLCMRAVSDATAQCWHELTAFKGKSKISDMTQILNFCKELDGTGPQQCVKTAHEVIGLLPSTAMDPCANALMTSNTNTMSTCLSHLKPHIYASSSNMAARDHGKKGVLDIDAIDFCAAAPSDRAVQCFLNSADMKLTASDRLKLCYGSDSDSGPVSCFNHLLFDNKKLSISSSSEDSASKSVVGERVALGLDLCAMASDQGPAVCFNDGLKMSSGDISAANSIMSSRSNQAGRLKGTGVASPDSSHVYSDTDQILLQLCQGSGDSGPVECFRNSQAVFRPADLSSDSSISWYRSLYGSDDNTGSGSGRGLGLGLEMRVHLCLHAPSSAPAECGLKAPQWLAAAERVHLCAEASQESQSLSCLKAVEAPAKSFHMAPKKILGYFLENIIDPEAQHARAMIMNMCSFSSSSNPLASAQCLLRAPTTLKLIDAVSLCTNVTVTSAGGGDKGETGDPSAASTSMVDTAVYISTCIRLAPRLWASEDLSVVCKGVQSGPEAQGAVSCVQGVMAAMASLTRIGATGKQALQLLPEAASTCHAWRTAPQDALPQTPSDADGNAGPDISSSKKKTKTATKASRNLRQQNQQYSDEGGDYFNAALDCVQTAVSNLLSEGRTALPEKVHKACAGAVSAAPGVCMAKIASLWRMNFEGDSDVLFCSTPGALSRIGCLVSLPAGKAVSIAAVHGCLAERVHASSAKSVRVWSSDPADGPEIKSGIRFSLVAQLYDQWTQPLQGLDNDVSAMVSINSNNEQGAVLWGTRSNVSHDGLLVFSSLVVSQPGPLEVKITTRLPSADGLEPTTVVLAIFRMVIRVNPALANTVYCTFIFKQAQCPAQSGRIVADSWENEFPHETAYFQPKHFLLSSACLQMVTELWGVSLHISPTDGSSIASYRAGVDAIWTGGAGFPSEEMSYERRLQLDTKAWTEEMAIVTASQANRLREVKLSGKNETKRGAAKASKDLTTKLHKMLKKAYYKKSLQWHPDRWSQQPLYADVVTRAFELINEANSELTRQVTELVTIPGTEDEASKNSDTNPMY